MNRIISRQAFTLFLLLGLTGLAPSRALYADAGPGDDSQSAAEAPAAKSDSTGTLGQFPQAEITPVAQTQTVAEPQGSNPHGLDFPKVKTPEDAELAKKFSWWPTDAKPAPFKDPDRSGYWWWPDVPGESRPWGNQGFIYVRKIIFDYKSSEGEMKPSLIIKKVLKNVKVYFDYDKADVREDAQQILEKALYTLQNNPQADMLITGSADVRGSEQYNFKLGERRAAAVKQYLAGQGLPEDRIRILSRGKLDAMAPVRDLVGMQKDRNAQFMIAEVEEVMIPASKAALFQDKVVEEQEVVEGAIKVDTRDYVIKEGDTLWKIAQREYGDGKQWKRLYEFNEDVIRDPNRPRRGTKIKIPIE
jgi:outer membrane protein OmpA-like peptidoglycan-associated protein